MDWSHYTTNPIDEPYQGSAIVHAKAGRWQTAVNKAKKLAAETGTVYYVDTDPRPGKKGWVVWSGPEYSDQVLSAYKDVIDIRDWHNRYMEYKVGGRSR